MMLALLFTLFGITKMIYGLYLEQCLSVKKLFSGGSVYEREILMDQNLAGSARGSVYRTVTRHLESVTAESGAIHGFAECTVLLSQVIAASIGTVPLCVFNLKRGPKRNMRSGLH
jgi:hypothetical protein